MLGGWETAAAVVAVILVALAGVVLAGAHLAARLFGSGAFSAGPADAAGALARLPSHAGAPAGAWGPAGAALPGPLAYYACVMVVAVAAVVVVVVARRVWKAVVAGPHPLGVEPHAGLARARHLRSLVVRGARPGRLSLGHVGGRLVAAEPQASLAVVGPSGCGKSAGFAIPALLEWEGPVLATSVKTDLTDATFERRCQLGEVWVYDPTGASGHESASWSPVPACGTWAGAMRMASWLCDAARTRLDSLADGDYWYTQARKALAPHLFAAAVGGHTMAEVVRWFDTQAREPIRSLLRRQGRVDEDVRARLGSAEAAEMRLALEPRTRSEILAAIRQVMAADPDDDVSAKPVKAWPADLRRQFEDRVAAELEARVRAGIEAEVLEAARAAGRLDALVAAEALWSHEERLRDSIYGTVQNVLLAYADPAVAAVGARCDIDLDAWLSGPNTIYVVATADEQERLRPVLTVLVQQAVRYAYEVANASGGTLTEPCLVLLDEAGNIAPLKDLPTYAATARSHGISLVSVWQDLAQLRAIYAQRAPTVLNNHRAKIFGTGISDADTLDYVSRLIGDAGYVERNFSSEVAGGGRRSVSEHTAYRRAAPVDVVRRLESASAVLVYGSELPAHLRLRPWFADRGLRALAGPQG